MKNTHITTTVLVAFTLLMAETSQAADTPMEKCKFIGPDGKGLIKARMSDCGAAGSSCAGANADGDPNAWIYLPSGVCEKIKGGNVLK